MALLEILTFPDPRLAKKAKPVDVVTPATTQLIEDMFETMYEAEGVGLAAPQVGVLERIIVVDCGKREAEEERPLQPKEPYAIVNPVVVEKDGKLVWEEGCLSVPGYTDEVERAATVRVEGLDKHGNPISIEAEGLLAVCLQHEIDHLEGVLFVDRLSRLKSSMVKKKLKKRALEEAATA
ncbi:MAG: peptide deformylase [Myxococcales bacterium]|nr:peptide deformylase [Myxococcales bacterium]MCB9647532.1 peptide deformylase [Deltaproteobacteria bacterium]